MVERDVMRDPCKWCVLPIIGLMLAMIGLALIVAEYRAAYPSEEGIVVPADDNDNAEVKGKGIPLI